MPQLTEGSKMFIKLAPSSRTGTRRLAALALTMSAAINTGYIPSFAASTNSYFPSVSELSAQPKAMSVKADNEPEAPSKENASAPPAATAKTAEDKVVKSPLTNGMETTLTPTAPLPSAPTVSNIDEASPEQLRQIANAAFWNDDYKKTNEAIVRLLKVENCSEKNPDHECFEVLMNLAICQLLENNVKESESLLKRLLPTATRDNGNNALDEPDCLFFLAECQYKNAKFDEAALSYSRALELYRKALPKFSSDLEPCIEGLSGCYYRKRNYAQVLPLYLELAKIDRLNQGPEDLRFAWSLLNLSDIYRKLGHQEEQRLCFERSVWIFRKVNTERLLQRFEKQGPVSAAALPGIKAKFQSGVYGVTDPSKNEAVKVAIDKLVDVQADSTETPTKRPNDFYNWRFKRSSKFDAPGFVIIDPRVDLNGLIICVHGLGLHHRSYEDFGNKMSKRGYGIVSFDMRGFGQYKDEKGYDQLDMQGCVEDLGAIIKLFTRDYPGVPLFILGESMGGAIAVHVAQSHQSELDGLISAVPSGERYDATKTDVKVAFKLLKAKNRQFDIGSQLIGQATKDEKLRRAWREDPSARLNLSPVELIEFQKFMNQNEKLAHQVDTLPTIIFQGYGDNLVKPEGTLALFNAIAAPDKVLVFLGHQEHLIFEENQCPPTVIDAVVSWLDHHSDKDSHAIDSK